MLWVSLVLVVVLGGATIWFHNETFIKWKPSVLYWAMGLAFWLSQLLFGKNLLRVLMGEQLQLPTQRLAAPELGLGRLLRGDGRCSTCGWPTPSPPTPGSTSSCSAAWG